MRKLGYPIFEMFLAAIIFLAVVLAALSAVVHLARDAAGK
jgi:hypothetical protein